MSVPDTFILFITACTPSTDKQELPCHQWLRLNSTYPLNTTTCSAAECNRKCTISLLLFLHSFSLQYICEGHGSSKLHSCPDSMSFDQVTARCIATELVRHKKNEVLLKSCVILTSEVFLALQTLRPSKAGSLDHTWLGRLLLF